MTDNEVAPAWIVSAEMLSVHSDLYIFGFSVQISPAKHVCFRINESAVCTAVCLTTLIPNTLNSCHK